MGHRECEHWVENTYNNHVAWALGKRLGLGQDFSLKAKAWGAKAKGKSSELVQCAVCYAEGLWVVTHAQTWASYSALYRFGRLSRPRPRPCRPRPRPCHPRPRPRPSWGVLEDPRGQGQALRTTRLVIMQAQPSTLPWFGAEVSSFLPSSTSALVPMSGQFGTGADAEVSVILRHHGTSAEMSVNSFSTQLLSSCTDENVHTYDISTYWVSSRLGFKTCFSKTKTKTKTLTFQDQDQDQDSEV